MNDTSPAAQATREREPAPEIEGKRSQPGYRLAVAGDERTAVRSGGGGPSVDSPEHGHRQRAGDAGRGVETIELDLPALAAALSRRLHSAGVPVTPERAVTLAQALTLVSPVSRRQLYSTARTVFVSSPAHLPAFDHVFASVFGGWPDADERPDDAEAA